MLKNRNEQGMSITFIIVAIIALIVLIAAVMIFSGKFDDFRSGIGKAVTCEDACKVLGMTISVYKTEGDCKIVKKIGYKLIPGDFSDRKGEKCCCYPN